MYKCHNHTINIIFNLKYFNMMEFFLNKEMNSYPLVCAKNPKIWPWQGKSLRNTAKAKSPCIINFKVKGYGFWNSYFRYMNHSNVYSNVYEVYTIFSQLVPSTKICPLNILPSIYYRYNISLLFRSIPFNNSV